MGAERQRGQASASLAEERSTYLSLLWASLGLAVVLGGLVVAYMLPLEHGLRLLLNLLYLIIPLGILVVIALVVAAIRSFRGLFGGPGRLRRRIILFWALPIAADVIATVADILFSRISGYPKWYESEYVAGTAICIGLIILVSLSARWYYSLVDIGENETRGESLGR